MREAVKRVVRVLALLAVVPQLISFAVRARIVGRDRALEGSTQALGLVPGLVGQYLRRAFLAHTIASCHETAAISFGTLFSQTGARIDAHVYVGAHCFLGLVHIERDVLIGSAVHVTSGRHTHGTGETSTPIREQEGERTLVRIGEGAWIGSAAVVMADVGINASQLPRVAMMGEGIGRLGETDTIVAVGSAFILLFIVCYVLIAVVTPYT